ncbi:SNAP25 homologous protein SNAP33-like [Impatiens glandulifera]|uniref:SNAP25 homologous protein SNAP33-like n=1 Tax=Impatiens glandulifera TaxID=253017 RepID=UPI001FB10408|nr:SNAP25 homologous protein SNAP33-like [Impatiens glandulifera]
MFGYNTPPKNMVSSNPFDSDDDESIDNAKMKAFSAPPLATKYSRTNPFDDDDDDNDNGEKEVKQIIKKPALSVRTRRIKLDELENNESLLVNKAEEETTKSMEKCLRIAEDIREEASKTLVVLHHQGEQITRTHMIATDIDRDLSRGEKLLGSLGGIFSRKWKPIKTRGILGPLVSFTPNREEKMKKKSNNARTEQSNKTVSNGTFQKVELEKIKQDNALSDLSDLLDELKDMAVDMGSEIDRQNKSLEPFLDEVVEINSRVKNATQRGRRLLGK